MPSPYNCRTTIKKLQFVADFFTQHQCLTLEELKQCNSFQKVDMFEHFKHLTVRSLRSRRSSLIGLVRTLREKYHLFDIVYQTIKQEYLDANPDKDFERIALRKAHERKKTIAEQKMKKQTQKTHHVESVKKSKKQRKKESIVKTARPKTTRPKTIIKQTKMQKRQLASKLNKKELRNLLISHPYGHINWQKNQQVKNAEQEEIMYIGLNDVLLEEQERLTNQIQSLQLAIAYAKMRQQYPNENILPQFQQLFF